MRMATGRIDAGAGSGLYQTAEAEITQRLNAGQITQAEADRMRTVTAGAITGNQNAHALRASLAERASLLNHRRLGVSELRDGRDVINAELQRVGVLDQNGNQLRGPANEREHMLVNAFGEINRELVVGGLTVQQFNSQLTPQLINQHLQQVQVQNPTMPLQQQQDEARRRAIGEIVRNSVGGTLTDAEVNRRTGAVEAVLRNVGQNPASHEDLSMRIATGTSAAEGRDLRRLRPRAQYMDGHAQFSLAAMGKGDLRMEKEAGQARADAAEYSQRIRDGLQPIFTLDEQRQADVGTLVNQTRTGQESGQELSVRSERIDRALQSLGRAQYLGTQGPNMQAESRRLQREGEQALRQLGIDPTTNAVVGGRVTQEAARSQLLDQRVVNTHQMAYNAQGQLYHISDENTPLGQTLQWANLAPPQGMGELYTTTAQQLYDYVRTADDRMGLTGRQEAFRNAGQENERLRQSGQPQTASPDIAVHLSEADRMNPAGQLEERWVSTVDGLSDEAARGLYECGIRTREDLAAAMQGPVVDPTGNITDPNTGQQVAVGGANPGERAILNAQGQWTTIEQVTGTAGNQWVLDAVNEGAQQSSWQREALSVERRVQDIDGEKYPIKRGLNGLRDEIEGVPRGET
jgi:hypothetical protein